MLGYSERQRQRWWATYTTGGLDALVQRPARLGRQAQVSDAAWAAPALEYFGLIRDFDEVVPVCGPYRYAQNSYTG